MQQGELMCVCDETANSAHSFSNPVFLLKEWGSSIPRKASFGSDDQGYCSEQEFLHGRHYNDRFTKYFARLLHLMPGIADFTHGHCSSFPFGENRVFHENVLLLQMKTWFSLQLEAWLVRKSGRLRKSKMTDVMFLAFSVVLNEIK